MDNELETKTLDIDWFKKTYFSDPDKKVSLKKGEVLLEPEQFNDKLYLILKGTLVGTIEDDGDEFEIFRSSAGTFVGVYSFFSQEHRSYSTVRADEDCELAYAEREPEGRSDEERVAFAKHFLPVVVNEVYMRQLLAQKASMDRHAAYKKLMQAEKMATLGQMAAGLAHELNNAIGVIEKKSEWLIYRLNDYMAEKDMHGMFHYFEKGFEHGPEYSTADIRKRKDEIKKKFKIRSLDAKKAARMGLTDQELKEFGDDLEKSLERIDYYYETGIALHDVKLATNHAAHVVRSVKEMGTANRNIVADVDINLTLEEALALLENQTKRLSVELDLKAHGNLTSNPGDLVQIWVNLIKNACESMLNSKTKDALLLIKSRTEGRKVVVNITDNGPGIPDDILPNIFQPNVTTKVHGLSFGLGLGLPIVQKLVEGYGGKISVTSKPGKTVFTISLPIN